MNNIGINEMKKIQTDMLIVIDKFCRANNIKYSLSQGSLIGAVRHKGFIPWDDDIDIMMLRPDYERFVNAFNQHHDYIKVHTPDNDDTYCHPYAKVYDERTYLYDSEINGSVYIDVWPIDGWPEKELVAVHRNRISQIERQLERSTKFYKFVSPKFYTYIKYLIKSLYTPSRKKICKKLREAFYLYPTHSASYVGLIVGPYGTKEYYPRQTFESYIELAFEGHKFMCIKDYDTYLSTLYGKYMELPPVEKRKPHHNYLKVCWK